MYKRYKHVYTCINISLALNNNVGHEEMRLNRPAKCLLGCTIVLAVLASATCAWSHEALPIGRLCVLFGPMLLISLGWDAWSYTPFFVWGVGLLAVSMLLVLPLAWRTSQLRLILGAIGIGVWIWAGSIAISIMSA